MGHVQSVERAFRMLESIVESGGTATLTQMAAGLGISMAGTHRLIRTLVKLGYARQLTNRSYGLGPGLIRLGESAVEQQLLAMQPALAAAVHQLEETATLAILDGESVVHTLQVQSSRGLRSTVQLSSPEPAHSSAAGKVLLSQLTDDEITRALTAAGTEPQSEHVKNETLADIRNIQLLGYIVDDGQEQGLRHCAVPVPGTGRPLAISVAGPTDRLGGGSRSHVTAVLKRAAQEMATLFQPVPVPARSTKALTA
ncbi:IclR family transcriptional regulator [Paenarthrobacter sp. YJN-5]|uniref:IclR family transcriptional regulator n=1 Tax=Paenarthrobacter sp. YJN-5 TaxID=2735316 RepID=UPI001877673D|nr:IclR family transcriptional regulator [Paenarthrobacter sp. YJN-5]QOT19823.1 IclR family transcriptional regulator [Paenarthrobacter sp. YJN-5]